MDFQKYIKRLSRFKSLTTIEIGFPTNGNMLLDLPKDFDDKFWTGQQLQIRKVKVSIHYSEDFWKRVITYVHRSLEILTCSIIEDRKGKCLRAGRILSVILEVLNRCQRLVRVHF